MSDPRIRVIDGCQHQLERMTQWADNGACPICLTADVGMAKQRIERLENALAGVLGLLQLISGRPDCPDAIRAAIDGGPDELNHRVVKGQRELAASRASRDFKQPTRPPDWVNPPPSQYSSQGETK